MKVVSPFALSLLLLLNAAATASAQDDYHYQRDLGFFTTLFMEKEMPTIQNKTVQQECGACHWAMLPGLLPERSWNRLMQEQANHFGEDLALDEQTATEIRTYLTTHAAELTPSKVSVKVLDKLGDTEAPLRISETAYWKRKHEDLVEDNVFDRNSIKSPANCVACHTDVERTGLFDEDLVEIPVN